MCINEQLDCYTVAYKHNYNHDCLYVPNVVVGCCSTPCGVKTHHSMILNG